MKVTRQVQWILKEGAKAELMDILDEAQVRTVDDPGLNTTQAIFHHNCFVDTDICVFL